MSIADRSDSKNYRYGFQGQEEDDETGLVSYKFRMHDPRTGRFFAIDPLAEAFAYNSPYAFCENRVIDGKELEGLEYKNATKWASVHLKDWITDWSLPSTKKRTYWSFSKHRDPNYQTKVKKTNGLQCIESVHFAYANGNKDVYKYLTKTGYFKSGVPGSHSRFNTFNYFKKGGKHHSLIVPNNATHSDVGDVIFYENTKAKNKWKQNGGHATLMASKPVMNSKGEIEYDEYTINAKSKKYDKRHVVLIKKGNDWVKKNNQNYKVQGFGRVDESKIVKEASEAKKKTKKS